MDGLADLLLELIKMINRETAVMLFGLLLGYGVGSAFADFDDLVYKFLGDFMEETFWGGVLKRLLQATHHYMIGLVLVSLFWQSTSLVGTILWFAGWGLILSEAETLASDINKIKRKLKIIVGVRYG